MQLPSVQNLEHDLEQKLQNDFVGNFSMRNRVDFYMIN